MQAAASWQPKAWVQTDFLTLTENHDILVSVLSLEPIKPEIPEEEDESVQLRKWPKDPQLQIKKV